MRVGIIGSGAVGSACLTALVGRRCAREIVVVNRGRKKARGLVTDVQYGAVLSAAVALRDGDYADLEGASLVPSIVGRDGVARILEPELSEDKRRGLQHSADTWRAASARIKRECHQA